MDSEEEEEEPAVVLRKSGGSQSAEASIVNNLYGELDNAPPSFSLWFAAEAAKRTSVAKFKVWQLPLDNSVFSTTCFGGTCGKVLSIMIHVTTYLLPAALIVIGTLFLKGCPAQNYIPIYLIVMGVFFYLIIFTAIYRTFGTGKMLSKYEEWKHWLNPIQNLIALFFLAWFITGSVWIYRAFRRVQSSEPQLNTYCHPILYKFAFWSTTSFYCIIGLVMLCAALGSFIACVCSDRGSISGAINV